ncbi:MAG: leucyl aminopeptidase family protein [Reyranella sp.]|uniref:leucyl aminopeptidase family protein n=1 Tax=Reyranella sp. TaxID=1929291 RepID=UPI0012212324|nr:leucyl aminopeptidase family protein [Reyranella sp.]TAJ92942.1 MAG: leucyl aminopeptidase family protein [Reyranella sp.]TBR30138.1 MAG: leucyl aminopeptidase family protein [Reyranella sp.]
MSLPFVDRSSSSLPLQFVGRSKWGAWLKAQSAARRAWVDSLGISGSPGEVAVLPGDDGKASGAVLVIPDAPTLWDFGALASKLPATTWRLDGETAPVSMTDVAVAIGLGAWKFERYRATKSKGGPRFVWPATADKKRAIAIVEAISMARDLITTPSSDMGPAELAAAAQGLAKAHKAKVKVIVGDDLLKHNYPTIHAVGRASARPPRLIDLTWGKASHPKVTLVGKGVCFDTGGLDLKPATGMLMMKKDMGGAANVLAVASMIMATGLPVRLRVLVPAVENSVAGNAFRPMDVIKTRKGITVEIGNTDAEGRLILCDALHEGASEKPAMMIDCATLTGAARVALGPDLPALFCNDDALADSLIAAGKEVTDPMWRMPLFAPYRQMLSSKVADINNVSAGAFGGSITAALYLKEFVPDDVPWAHFDMMAWNNSSRPGRPEGGEAQVARAIYRTIADRFGK